MQKTPSWTRHNLSVCDCGSTEYYLSQRGGDMTTHVNFRFHVVIEYSFAISVTVIFHLVCESYYFASRPSGMWRLQ